MATFDSFVLRSVEEVQALEGPWQELLAATAAPELFRTFEWLMAWWRVFGGEGRFRLLVIGVRRDGALIGLAPLVVREDGHVRRLSFMGTGEDEADEICSDFPDVIAARGYEAVVCDETWRRLQVESGSWDEARWGNILESSLLIRYLRPMARDAGLGVDIRPAGERFVVDLEGRDFPAYVEGLSRNRKKRIYYYRRRMEKEGGLTERRVQSAAEIPVFLGEIARLSQRRQGEKGEGSAWESARFVEFHRQVLPPLLARGWLDLRSWWQGDRCVAALYNVVYAGTIYYYQSGFDTEAFGNVSPGLYTLSQVIEWGFTTRQRRFDFLVGNEGSYKEDYGCRTESVLDLQVFNITLTGHLAHSANQARRLWQAAKDRFPSPSGFDRGAIGDNDSRP
jgi:CelD/BcsL family acetyltransferase involved in cellulose biosynthesis